MEASGLENDSVGMENSNLLHDNLFPLWEHLLTKANRRVGLYEILGQSQQNTSIPRDFRNCLGVNHTYELRIDIFRSYLEERVKSQWPTIDIKSDINVAIQDYNLKVSLASSPRESTSDTTFTYEGQGVANTTAHAASTPLESIVIIGVITTRQRINPYEIHQMCKKIGVLPLPMQHKECFFGENNEDCLFLMDRTSRIKLKLPNYLTPGKMLSGIVSAVKGTMIQRNFVVEEIIFPTPVAPIWPQVSKLHNIEMVFISGLHIGKIAEDFIHRNLLMEYLQGLSGCPAEQEHIVKRKTRAFILGNIFCSNRKRNGPDSNDFIVETAKLVDEFISQLSTTMEVFLLPGENDPSSTPILPQPPIHSNILPMSKHKPNFRNLSNPANLKVSVTDPASEEPPVSVVDGECVHLVLSSGKNVKDAMRGCNIKCPLEMAKKLLEWSHLNPTSQQVIPLCAGSSEEFFALNGVLPHIFALGNQSSFGVESWNGVKIISVPDFEKTATIALLNFELDVLPMSFRIAF